MVLKQRSIRILFILTALVLALSSAVVAQDSRGRVQGAVLDQTSAVVPGAKVVLHNVDTAVDLVRESNTDGRYLFDYIDPGTYTLTVEKEGFKRGIQKNIIVQQRGDVTVDIALEIGGTSQVVEVTAAPVAVEFNTASRDLTIETKMVQNLPSATRNPLQLALLDPTVINRGSLVETQPYHHRTANEMDIGGGTKYRNDFVLDGTPLVAGNKLGYTPPMDAVTEYTIQQNSVDAEFGHNSGGVAIVTMKSGTNQIHGSAYYYGRDPSLNALSDRFSGKHNETPYWNAGGTIGFPIIKKKLFFFGVYERILNNQVIGSNYTLPTALERQGDFSQSFNADNGTLRTIYDPLTGVNNAARTAFPDNKIPEDRWDPLAKKIMDSLWDPNNPGDDISGFNNFKYNEERKFHYYNFTTRADWQINDNWKAFGRVSRIKTDQDSNDFTGGNDPLKLRNVSGTKRNGWNIAGDTVYTFNPTTVLDLRGAFYKVEDKRDYPAMNIGDYSSFWPDNRWWEPYMAGRPLVYAPYIVVDSTARGLFGVNNYWFQEPNGYSLHARLNKYLTKHALKFGTEIRWKRGQAARFRFGQFQFISTETANKYSGPDKHTGSPWASFLLGYMDPTTTNTLAQYSPMQHANTEMYGFYVQDDIKLTRNITLNVGLRYEYEGGFWDDQYRIQQALDLTDPVPGMADAIGPVLNGPLCVGGQPPCSGGTVELQPYMSTSAGQNDWIYNGAFHFTSSGDKRGVRADNHEFMPRAGLAWRLGDKTAIRVGYGRFYTPTSLIMPDRDANGELPMGAFSPTTTIRPEQTGVPQVTFSDPFPDGLTAVVGKDRGRYTQLGDAVTFDQGVQRPPISDRINFSLQRELPFKVIVDATYLMNFVSRDQWTRQLNIMDPRLSYTYGTQLNTQVQNPFYNYQTVDTFPGPLRNRKTVSMASLLVPYPQYGNILQTASDLRSSRYNSFELRFQRPFENGLSMLVTYAYSTQRTQMFYDIQDEYDGKLTWMDGAYSPPGGTGVNLTYAVDPKHHLNAAVTYALPFGRGKRFGSGIGSLADAFIGGWHLSGIYTYNAGQKLAFTQPMIAPDSVKVTGKVGKDNFWFNRTGFDTLPSCTADGCPKRSNPWYFDNLMGPGYKNLDMAIYKQFRLTEKFNLETRLEAYNAVNQMNYANPTVDPTKLNSDFGRVTSQAQGYYGRQLQYSARLTF